MGAKKGMNVVIAVGNLGKDAEMKYSQNGKPIVTFSMAATTGFGEYEQTEWFNCVAFGDRFTNVAQYLKKGQMIGISGSLQTRSWEDNEGKKHYRTEVKVNELTLLGNGNGNGNGNAGGNGSAGATADQTTGAGDEIPF